MSNGARQVAESSIVESAGLEGVVAVCVVVIGGISGAVAVMGALGVGIVVADAGCKLAEVWGTLSIEPKGMKGRSPQLLRRDSVVIGIAVLEI